MAIAAQYVNLPYVAAQAVVSAANTNRDGTGTIVNVVTAGRAGGRIERLRVQATATTTAGFVRLYRTLADGTTHRLIDEIPVSAVTPSATVAAFFADRSSGAFPLILGPGESLRASTHNAESFNVIVLEGGDF